MKVGMDPVHLIILPILPMFSQGHDCHNIHTNYMFRTLFGDLKISEDIESNMGHNYKFHYCSQRVTYVTLRLCTNVIYRSTHHQANTDVNFESGNGWITSDTVHIILWARAIDR